MKRKLWYAFEEKECLLIYYKSQNDWTAGKTSLGSIDIKGAAIRLNLSENNQFVIMSHGREYMLTADNHESMMIWLLGLQAKRDANSMRTAKKTPPSDDGDPPPMTQKQRTMSEPVHYENTHKASAGLARDSMGRSSFQGRLESQQHQRLLKKLAESMDDGLDMYADGEGHVVYLSDQEVQVGPPLIHFTVSMGVQADVSLERGMPQSRSLDAMSATFHSLGDSGPDRRLDRHHSNTSNGSLSSSSIIEEVFTDDFESAAVEGTETSGSDTSGKVQTSRRPDERGQGLDKEFKGRTRSQSLRSTHSDSGVSVDRSQDLESGSQLTELEQELLAAKLEVAKMKNQTSAYQTILEKRDILILEQDEKIEKLQEQNKQLRAPNLGSKKTMEEIRVLQNQNLFLNGEVIKLANLLQQEREIQFQKEVRAQELLSLIEQWKRDYVYLLQSSITVPTGDLTDGMEVRLYGGNRHKERIQELLEEARQSNPGLPSFDRLAKSEVHIDNYGFKHHHNSEGLLLHYICTQLHQFYTCQLSSYEEHQKRWKDILTRAKTSLVKTKELKVLCRRGIPPQYRHEMWRQLVYNQIHDLMEEKGSHYFSNLLNNIHESENASRYKKQISLDLLRTMPNNINFNSMNSQGIQRLQEVLLAFCVHSPEVGYCQGMNFIVAMCLLFMDAEDAFWALVAITERYFSPSYFDSHLSGAQADQDVLKELMMDKLPRLYDYLDNLDIEISTVTLNWFLAIFFDGVPFETLIRIWDCFLLEGPKVLFRIALAILKIHEPSILKKQDTISIMRHLKSCAALTFDVDGLYKIAFEELRPFPRRQDIASKQAVYLKTLKEKLKRQDQQRREYEEKDQMFRQIDVSGDVSKMVMFECATVTDEGIVWVCYGEQSSGKICLVCCDNNQMYDIKIQVDSRILCICYVQPDIILVGTLAKNLHAFNKRSRQECWTLRLHDTILSLNCLQDKETNILFAALADGTVAILENISEMEPMEDPFHIPVGRCPVTSMVLIDRQLWCACGNNVHILHAETLDTLDRFVISSNPFDNILSMAVSEAGVWIAVKGSAILELWDPVQLTCKMLYDVKSYKHPTMIKEDDGHLNPSRITTILPVDNTIWVGTGDGNLSMFEVLDLSTASPVSSTRNSPRQSKRWSRTSPSHRSSTGSPGMGRSPDKAPVMVKDDSGIDLGFAVSPESPLKKTIKTENVAKQKSDLALDLKSLSYLKADEVILRPHVLGLSTDLMAEKRKISPTESVKSLPTDMFSLDENANNKQFGEIKKVFAVTEATRASDVVMMSAREHVQKQNSGNDSHFLGDVGVMFTKGHKLLNLHLDNTSSDNNNESVMLRNREDRKAIRERRKKGGFASFEFNDKETDSDDTVTSSMTEEDVLIVTMDHMNKAVSIEQESNNYQSKVGNNNDDSVLNQVLRKKAADNNKTGSPVKPESLALDNTSPRTQAALKILSPICESPLTEATEWTKEEVEENVPMDRKLLTPDVQTGGSVSLAPGLSPISEGRESSATTPSMTTSSLTSPECEPSMRTSSDSGPSSDTRPSVSSEPETPSDSMFSADYSSSRQPLLSPSISIQEDTDAFLSPEACGPIDTSPDFSPVASSKATAVSNLELEKFLKQEMPMAMSTPDATAPDNLAVPAGGVVMRQKSRNSHSRSASNVSSASCLTLTELPYTCELNLMAKIKISSFPIKCLIMTRSGDEDVVVSCSGCFGDDEAVLKWRREEDEKLWTNEPVFELCPDSNRSMTPLYMRQLSSSSHISNESCDSIKSYFTPRKSGPFASPDTIDLSLSY